MEIEMNLKSVLKLFCAGCLIALSGSVFSYPTKTVTIVVPFTPGGAVDIVARTVATGLAEKWSQSVVVENKPGGGGAIGIQYVARSNPDGYTLLLGSVGPITVNPSLGPVAYDVSKELAPIVLIAKTPAVLVTLPTAPAQNLNQFIAWAKSKPDGLNYGSAGNGNITHLVNEYFLSSAGISARHIPYKGSAPAIADLLGGQIDFMFDVVPTAQPLIKSGKFKALAVTTIKRSSVLPEVPTLDELGYKGFDVSSWFSLMAPVGTPKEVVSQINLAVNEVLKSSKFRDRLDAIGAYSAGGSPEDLNQFIKSETIRWKKVIDEKGIKPE
jgi:tripartite-type tricarboxylate transporter receptor subunit TctC